VVAAPRWPSPAGPVVAHCAALIAAPEVRTVETEAFAIVSRRVVTAAGVQPAAVVVRGEQIAAILPPQALGAGVAVRDVGDLVVMAGLVDCHVHINEPGRTEWEGFRTATQAAAAGGVTSLVDMPLNCVPVTTSAAALAEKLAQVEGQLHVDTGFWGGVVPGNRGELAGLAAAGALGCKAFLVDSGVAEFPCVGPAELGPAMAELARLGLPLLAHAELDLGAEADAGADPRRYASYLASRPARWEEAAIELLVDLARQTGCRVHIVHLSAASALPQLRRARADQLAVSAETCPHYLCLAAEEVPDGATVFKCAPPIRERANRDLLWSALGEGVIDMVVSDHSPCTTALKQVELGDFQRTWGGVSSLQLALPLLWTEASGRGHDVAALSRWLSAAPARLAGLPGKGRLAVGGDADLLIWDPEAEFVVTAESLRFRHKHSPYLGRRLRGVVRQTYLRGQRIFDAGADQVLARPPRGRPLLGRRRDGQGGAT
jgi:allantoinase